MPIRDDQVRLTVYVFAKSYSDFTRWVMVENLNKSVLKFVNSEQDIRGKRGEYYILLPDWMNNSNYPLHTLEVATDVMHWMPWNVGLDPLRRSG